MVLFSVAGFAQQVTLQGRVTNSSTDVPIVGASLVVSGTEQATQTNENGEFTLLLTGNNVSLEVSYVGYETQTVATGNTRFMEIRLVSVEQGLEEVVVTGYQTERKKDITGAVSVVNLKDINQQATGNAMKSLQGKVPGVYITSNGSPRGAATVRIRGIGTLNNNDPLYIIDGVPTKAGLHTINQLDIESMQVLKDASAASIYGSRAANGVIIITTKRGKKDEAQVDFNSYVSASSFVTKLKMLNTQQYAEVLWRAQISGNADPNALNLPFQFDYHQDGGGKQILDNITIKDFLDPAMTLKTSNTDWFDEITQTGITQNYDASVSKGNAYGTSLFSLGYFKNDGLVKESSFARTSLRFNSDYNLFDNHLKLGENFSIVHLNEGGSVPLNEAIQAAPMIPVRTADGLGWGGPFGSMNDRHNPVRIIEDNKQNRDLYVRLLGNIYGELKVFDLLTYRSNFGLDYGQDYIRNWQKSYVSGYLENPLNKVTMRQWHDLKTTWTNTLHFTKHIKDVHNIDALVGIELFNSRYATFFGSREDYVTENPEFMYLESGTGQKDNDGSGSRYSLLSYFGKVNYTFKDRYLASATLRYDGSSRFGENYKFGVFPAFSLGWRINEERFVKELGLFDELKLRYGWGITGNQEIDNHAIFDIYSVDYNTTAYDISGAGSGTLPSGYVQTQTGNKNLKWESTIQSNIGLDFSVKNQLVYGTIDYYVKDTEDILLKPGYLAVYGEGGGRWLNGASMQNKGLEIAFGNRTQVNNALSFNASVNFDFVRNKVTYLPDEVVNSYGGDARVEENILGRTLGSYYGYVADGLFRSQEEVDAHGAQQGKAVGRIRYRDLDGNNIINDYDRTWIGVPLPDFTYGLNLGINYKQFDLSLFIQGVSGIDVHNEIKVWTDFWSVTNVMSNKGARLYDAWSIDNPTSDIPAISLINANDEGRLSTYLIENGSYMKLRNIQLAYNLNEGINLGKYKTKSARFYVNVDNAGILYKNKGFTGIDPESPAFGYPNPLVMTAGINIKL
ncbi:TonB-dependent receptor [Sphingobacterium phlebotomi]|uniref:TonB-dependent receptor n=2 Tax=Sphingobacterium phlebotomi TaxID=2605433 RepID=A0A5D4GZC9_9SPHI|nr:TonB-dependent receptor [Sphingobacterium phlebotomi]